MGITHGNLIPIFVLFVGYFLLLSFALPPSPFPGFRTPTLSNQLRTKKTQHGKKMVSGMLNSEWPSKFITTLWVPVHSLPFPLCTDMGMTLPTHYTISKLAWNEYDVVMEGN